MACMTDCNVASEMCPTKAGVIVALGTADMEQRESGVGRAGNERSEMSVGEVVGVADVTQAGDVTFVITVWGMDRYANSTDMGLRLIRYGETPLSHGLRGVFVGHVGHLATR